MSGPRSPRIGYVPYDPSLSRPGDRRRFPRYARLRGLDFEVAQPGVTYDLVVLSARADIVEWARAPRKTKLVYDLIDSYLRLPDLSPRNLLRGAAKYASAELSRPVLHYRKTVEAMCRRADAVVCTTDEQAADIAPFCERVHVILDFHDEFGDHRKSDHSLEPGSLRIVWEGLPATIAPLRLLTPVLSELGREREVSLHLVTDLHAHRFMDRYRRVPTGALLEGIHRPAYLYEWNVFALTRIAAGCDIAVIPLDLTNPLFRGKPENKLDLFWRLGVPAVVSATPAHERAMRAAGLDFACGDDGAWLAALRRLVDDEDLRRSSAERGRRYALARQGRSSLLAAWDRVLESVL